MAAETAQADAPDTVRPDDAASAGVPVSPVVAAEAEERDLNAAFFKPERWWVGELPGLGVMRLPLP